MIQKEPELLGVTWFSNSKGLVGVVAVRDPHEGVKFYISAADGFNEVIDSNLIMNLGARFPDAAGHALFNGIYT